LQPQLFLPERLRLFTLGETFTTGENFGD